MAEKSKSESRDLKVVAFLSLGLLLLVGSAFAGSAGIGVQLVGYSAFAGPDTSKMESSFGSRSGR
jgi:hypothetical protein